MSSQKHKIELKTLNIICAVDLKQENLGMF